MILLAISHASAEESKVADASTFSSSNKYKTRVNVCRRHAWNSQLIWSTGLLLRRLVAAKLFLDYKV